MKKNFYLVLDVETANSTEDALTYDVGYAICDKKGNIYETRSMIVSEIFDEEADLMTSAYYGWKVPMYREGIAAGDFEVMSFRQARFIIAEALDRYDVVAVCAYNANFDVTALNTTQRWLTKSKYRYFLPYGTKVYCIWNMACQVICTQKSYVRFCLDHGFVSPAGNIKTSAEVVYAYMTKNPNFDESHTGLADVLIETQIMAKCLAQHKKMERNINRMCWRTPQANAKKIKKELGY